MQDSLIIEMDFFNLGEVTLVWEFVPTLVFLTGLTVLWARTVCMKLTVDNLTTLPSVVSLLDNNVVEQKRYGYYFHSYLFEPKSPTGIIKSNLLWLTALTFALELLVNYSTWGASESGSYFNGMIAQSPILALMKLVTLAFMWAAILYSNTREDGVSASILMLIGTVLFFMLVLISANNMIALYVALEGMSLILFVLTAQPKTNVAVESGLKYFFQSSFASVLLLLGIAITFAGTQEFDFTGIRWELVNEPLTPVNAVGFFLITVALLFKVSAFPGHLWAPDVYRGPTASVLTVFAVVVKAAAFFVLLNVYYQFLSVIHVHFSWLLYLSSAASMLIGALGAIRVINEAGSRRQFIAYTSINQVGFVRLGLVCLSFEGFWASFIYLIVYLLASILFLGVISRIRILTNLGARNVMRLDELRRVFNSDAKFSRRIDLFVLAYAVWSMAGLPPLAGFFGKVALWSSLLHKLDSLVSGAAWKEVEYSFKFVDSSLEFDPFLAIAFILALSIVVSIISGVYYFKLYELMAPVASTSEISRYFDKRESLMMHDRSSVVLTARLVRALVSWFFVICWSGWHTPFVFPFDLLDATWSSWVYDFNGYVM